MINNLSLTHKAKDKTVADRFLIRKWQETITETTHCRNILLA